MVDKKQSTELSRIMQQQTTAIAPVQQETASQAMAAQSKALVEARYVVAMKNPRDFDAVREKLLRECRRPSFAGVARYKKPIGKGVEGPSIRFAEAAIRAMTNIVVETTTTYDDPEKRIVHVEVCDLEANVPYGTDVTISKTVERRRVQDGDVVLRQRKNKSGDTVYIIEANDDDILNKQQALISKAIRTQGLRLVPGDLIDECEDVIKETLSKQDAADPDAAKRKLYDSFGSVGVRVEQIKEYLGHDGQTLSPKELSDLRGLYAALRDGETSWREIMDSRSPTEKQPSMLASVLAGQHQAETVDPSTGEVTVGQPQQEKSKPEAGEHRVVVRGKKQSTAYETILKIATQIGPDGLQKACETIGVDVGKVTRDYDRLDDVKVALEAYIAGVTK